MPTVFLDHQSSTPVLPEASEAMRLYLLDFYGNPSSLHRHGHRARGALAKARAQFAELINAQSPDDLIFVSGGTEAANLAVKGAAWANQGRGRHIVVSATEHPAVLNSVEFLQTQGFSCSRVPVDRFGFVDPERVRAELKDETILVCVHHVNHEVGAIEPIQQISQVARERGVPLFVDATASAGWLPIDVQALGVDLLSLTAHRFYGPKGCGVLFRQRGVRLTSLIHGGDQERGRRAGTENIPAIVGAGIAAESARLHLETRRAHTADLQKQLWAKLRSGVPQLTLNGPEPGPDRLSTNLNVSAAFTEGEGQLLALDMAGVAVASGAMCVSKAVKTSHVLEALGIDRALAQASVVFSLGKDNTQAEVDFTVAAYQKVVEKLRRFSPSWDEFQQGMLTPAVGSEPPSDAQLHSAVLKQAGSL
jgi:cysteine desulfurase